MPMHEVVTGTLADGKEEQADIQKDADKTERRPIYRKQADIQKAADKT